MSLTKKDPSLRVAANDPHLVSLGGGRLSTAVTIHYIPIGDMTIGSSSACSISLNGSGVRPIHCTIYRSEENEVTLVPESDARVLIDGTKITHDTNLTQGAMITIGNSNYLRFNNPAEARMMLSAMGSNERISMPQIDFTQVPQRNSAKSNDSSNGSTELRQSLSIDTFYEEHISPAANAQMTMSVGRDTLKGMVAANKSLYSNVTPIDINGLQCPKVFTADLVTVNMPAKDVLGQKYANFAKNLAENLRSDKNVNVLRNNQLSNNLKSNGSSSNAPGNYVNIPSTSNFIQNNSSSTSTAAGSSSSGTEYLTKVNNTTPLRGTTNHQNISAYDRYPKPGTYGGLQIFPMNGVNTEINNGSTGASPMHNPSSYEFNSPSMQRRNLTNLSSSESERLEDMLKICTEYADRQNQSCSSVTSSPIVQNRIKTNGSLPREKKSPFYHDLSGSQLQQSFTNSSSSSQTKTHNGPMSNSSGYENVRLVGQIQNRVEVGGQSLGPTSPKTGYENVIGKYVPQSPRTKIRTTCMSPKKEQSFSNAYGQAPTAGQTKPPLLPKPNTKCNEYDQLIKTFEEKLKLEMLAIEESSRYRPQASKSSAEQSPAKRLNKNINNLTLNLQESSSLQSSPKLNKKPAPAPRIRNKAASIDSAASVPRPSVAAFAAGIVATTVIAQRSVDLKSMENSDDLEELKKTHKELWQRVGQLKNEISELQKQEDEMLREFDMEKALVTAEVNSVGDSVGELESQLEVLYNKIHRMEAQRNATRVMEENQQAKLKQSIEMKQDQVRKLKSMLQQKPNNDCLKEELHNVSESLENDRKTFEDLEFQYLEEESEWHAYREELHAEEIGLKKKVEEKRQELQHLKKEELNNQSVDAKTLKLKLLTAYNELKSMKERLKTVEGKICDIAGQLQINSSDDDESIDDKLSASTGSPSLNNNMGSGVMSQSLFGSAELLCPKHNNEDIMSKSVNENMFYNNKIELPTAQATSTPKRSQFKAVPIDDMELNSSSLQVEEPKLRSKRKEELAESERIKFNLSLGSDDFEVNPLERRVPSQDDIDRISKVTTNAPISTKGASTKIFDSIKEIERNRQLLLAQQGHHVIEHERQKINDLKKKCHDEARAQYLSMLSSGSADSSSNNSPTNSNQVQMREMQRIENEESARLTSNNKESQQSQRNSASGNGKPAAMRKSTNAEDAGNTPTDNSSQQRHSQPEFETQHQQQRLQHSRSSSRPLSEANSELSYDLLAEQNSKSNFELSSTTEHTPNGEDAFTKRSSVNSNETTSGGSGHSERKRALPKHQRPLTRYLPIFSPDLNLRHHIESAGHQIALCPHVFVDAYSCRGYLHKLGATFHGWARRWFVLDRQRSAFIYYADKSERKPRGGAYFSTIDEVYLDHLNASKSGRPHCTFIVKTKKRSYHLQAASDAAARIWIDAIITGAQGNLDY